MDVQTILVLVIGWLVVATTAALLFCHTWLFKHDLKTSDVKFFVALSLTLAPAALLVAIFEWLGDRPKPEPRVLIERRKP